MASLITSFPAWHLFKFNLAACALGTQWVSLNFTAVSFHSLCDTFLSTFDSSVISSNCAFFAKRLYHNNLAEQVGEDDSDVAANLCKKLIYGKPGQLASVFHVWWWQKGAASLPSLVASLKTVKSAVKELHVRGKFYFLQADHSFILKAELVDSAGLTTQGCETSLLQPRLLSKSMWVFFSKTDEEAGFFFGKCVCVCMYECRNAQGKYGCFPFSIQYSVPGRWGEETPAPQHGPGISRLHRCYLLPRAEQHFLKSLSKADAGKICASVSGFV